MWNMVGNEIPTRAGVEEKQSSRSFQPTTCLFGALIKTTIPTGASMIPTSANFEATQGR